MLVSLGVDHAALRDGLQGPARRPAPLARRVGRRAGDRRASSASGSSSSGSTSAPAAWPRATGRRARSWCCCLGVLLGPGRPARRRVHPVLRRALPGQPPPMKHAKPDPSPPQVSHDAEPVRRPGRPAGRRQAVDRMRRCRSPSPSGATGASRSERRVPRAPLGIASGGAYRFARPISGAPSAARTPAAAPAAPSGSDSTMIVSRCASVRNPSPPRDPGTPSARRSTPRC